MINKIFLNFIIIFFITSCNVSVPKSNYYREGLKFTLKTARQIEKDNNLELVSYGINNNGFGDSPNWNGIHDFTFFYRKIELLNINEARKLLIKLVDETMRNINENGSIKEYLVEYPFKIENLDLGIVFKDKNRKTVFGKNIESCGLNNRKISYTIIPDDDSLMLTYEESYEDAVEIVKNNIETDPVFTR
ncbi:MAG: hypothetical protein K1060chlam5_00596 [Candidatus Anoxychlamydiales bacterium]|nr:hypothetical protein [Candidatus Anoxychlamydiales bacterium]